MQKFFYSLIVLFSVLVGLSAQSAQDSIVNDSLLISEIRLRQQGTDWGYVELYNSSSRPIELSNYFFTTNSATGITGITALNSRWKTSLEGILQPHDTYLIVSAQVNGNVDGWGVPLYPDGYANIYARLLADRIVGNSNQALDLPGSRLHSSNKAQLFYRRKVLGDSVMVDMFGWNVTAEQVNYPIAGYVTPNPSTDYIYARKTNVKKGNTDWNSSRGTSLDDSEWLPLPTNGFNMYAWPFTTLGEHSNTTSAGLRSTIVGVEINTTNKTITLPYGIRRDSVFRTFTYNKNVAWEIKIGNDSTQYYMQTGDTLIFYSCGDALTIEKYRVNVYNKPEIFLGVSPLIYKNANGIYVSRYTVSNGYSPDTIGNVPFETRGDTLMKYLKVEEGCLATIKTLNDEKRADLKEGDILLVKKIDGTEEKEYKISVMKFLPNHNSNVKMIIMPGFELWENPHTYFFQDTLFSFSPSSRFYQVELPEGTAVMPAIVAIPESNRSKVEVIRAQNLRGNEEQRTAIIKCTAEDDTTITDYKILFTVKRTTPPLKGEPFITDVCGEWGNRGSWNYQLYNPNDDYLDFSDYMLITHTSGQSLASISSALKTDTTSMNILRPGYQLFKNAVGSPIFGIDYDQKTIVIDPRSTYSICPGGGFPNKSGGTQEQIDKIDFNKLLVNDILTGAGRIYYNGGMSLHKILNDSVKEGTKSPYDFDHDFELVDVLNGVNSLGTNWIMYDKINGVDSILDFSKISHYAGYYRKPNVFSGNPLDRGSFGILGPDTTVLKESEWIVYGVYFPNTLDYDISTARLIGKERFENHSMITSVNVPYITSATYLISEGIEGPQTIYGVSNSTTVSLFISNINIFDGMSIKITDASGNGKSDLDIINSGDKVSTTSGDGNSSVNYTITVGQLDNNVLLTSKEYTITKTDNGWKISNIPFGTNLDDLITKITVPSTAVYFLTNGSEMIIPMVVISNDSNIVGSRVKTIATPGMFIEVVAQDGVTKGLYELEFANAKLEVLSDVYLVNQLAKIIDMVNWTSVNQFISNLKVNRGVSITVMDKYGVERVKGTIAFDDIIKVTDGTNTIYYHLKFKNEQGEGAGVENNIKEKHAEFVSAFPNPANDIVYVQSKKKIISISITDLSGKLLEVVHPVSSFSSFDVSVYPEGIYLLQVKTEDRLSYTLKLVRQ